MWAYANMFLPGRQLLLGNTLLQENYTGNPLHFNIPLSSTPAWGPKGQDRWSNNAHMLLSPSKSNPVEPDLRL